MGPLKHPLQTAADQQLDTGRGKACACGAVISVRMKRCKRCRCRLAQARYQHTEKGRATTIRYARSEKRKVSQARHDASEKKRLCRAREIRVGKVYQGKAKTVEQAAMIRHYIKERTREFIERQSARAQAEGAPAGTISTQAEP